MIGLDYLEEPESGDDISPYFTGRVFARNVQLEEEEEDEIYSDDFNEESSVMLRSSSVLTVWESQEPEEGGTISENRCVCHLLGHFSIRSKQPPAIVSISLQ